ADGKAAQRGCASSLNASAGVGGQRPARDHNAAGQLHKAAAHRLDNATGIGDVSSACPGNLEHAAIGCFQSAGVGGATAGLNEQRILASPGVGVNGAGVGQCH